MTTCTLNIACRENFCAERIYGPTLWLIHIVLSALSADKHGRSMFCLCSFIAIRSLVAGVRLELTTFWL